ncbi:TonB-dependent siderophore receptor [Aurantimonas sp. MSK8Z-1]|uniref:TonB-dependent siderophore receptor n=1 Tax=Mangrovibrevibacter kandeliae TaxID=2968473 RepID=UPI002118D185|nr:TonB-dependent siderophore receptor [Aurantimonas sp. MSK8Z-1]
MSLQLRKVPVPTPRSVLFATVAMAALTAPAAAQETIQLEQVTVDGVGPSGGIADPAPVEGYVAKDTTAGSKTAAPIAEVPQSVSVLGREELDDRGVQKVDEALRYTAGVFAQPFGKDTDTDWIYIRGFDATQTGVSLDGLPLFQYAFAGIIVDPFLLDRVEVLRGPASVLYGGSNAGGLVNSVMKRADGEHHGYAETGIDDTPNGYVGLDLGGRFIGSDAWSWRVVGRVKGGRTDVDYADNLRGTVAPSLLFEPDADTRLELYATYEYDDQRHTNGFFPYVGTVVDAPYGRIDRSFYYSEPELDRFEHKQASVGYEFEHRLNDTVTLRSNTRYLYLERNEYGPYLYDTVQTDDVLNRLNFAHDTDAGLFTTDNQAIFSFDTGAVRHELLTGVDYKHYRIDQTQAVGAADPLSATNPVYTNNLPPLFAPYTDEVVSLDQLGVYAQDQLKFGDGWIVTLNGRYDEVWIDRDDRTSFDVDYDGEEGSFSGRAGIAYAFANGLTPYASVSRFFDPQIGTDANNEALPPQTGEQYEIGLKYAPTFLDATFTASLFDLTRRNTVQSDANFVPRAVGEVRSRGIELEANANLTESLKLTAAFTAYDLEITENVDPTLVGNRPYLVPEVLGSLWLDYTLKSGPAEGLGFGGGLRYVGSSYADNQNTLEVPSVTLFDAAIHYEKDDWGVSLNVNNVFDEAYVSGCQQAYSCAYGEGRSGLLKAHVKF